MTDHDATMDPREVRVGGLTCAEAEEMAALCVLDMLTTEEAAPVHAHLAGCGADGGWRAVHEFRDAQRK